MAYRQTLDKFALQALIKQPEIPDFHLMVGSAEHLDSMPLLVQKNASVPNEVVSGIKSLNKYTNSELQQAIADNVIEVDDLNFNIATIGGSLEV